MREACGLSPRSDAAVANPVLRRDSSSQEAEEKKQEFVAIVQAVIDHLWSKNSSSAFMTATGLSYVKLPPHSPKMARAKLVEVMLDQKYLLKIASRTNKELLIPFLRSKAEAVSKYVALPDQPPAQVAYPEIWHLDRLQAYAAASPTREHNIIRIVGCLDATVKRVAKKHGKKSEAEKLYPAKLTEMRESIEKCEQKIADCLAAATRFAAGSQSPRQRQTSKKAPVLSRTTTYRMNPKLGIRGRRYCNELSAQGRPHRLLFYLCPDTVDLDIENAFFSIMSQFLQKLYLSGEAHIWVEKVLRQCAQERKQICTQQLRICEFAGKRVLLQCVHGGVPEKDLSGKESIKQLQQMCVCLKWIAISACPDLGEARASDPACASPENSVLALLYQALEDSALDAWLQCILQRNCQHVSLHFDGIRVILPPSLSAEQLCNECTEHIANATGFKLSIRVKKHYLLLEEVARACACISQDTLAPCFEKAGNCIPAALAFLFEDWARVQVWLQQASAENEAAERHKCRNYRACASESDFCLRPSLGLQVVCPGRFLLHTEHRGHAACAAIRLSDQGDCAIFMKSKVYSATLDQFLALAEDAIDAKTFVTFACFTQEAAPVLEASDSSSWLDLLDLQAGQVEPPRPEQQDSIGGVAFPPDTLACIATCLLDAEYLCNFAACSKALLNAVMSKAAWQALSADLRSTPTWQLQKLRAQRICSILRLCSYVHLTLAQINLAPDLQASNVRVHWSGRFRPSSNPRIRSWVSDDVLFGHGEVQITVPDRTTALYVGATTVDLQTCCFCRILFPFEDSMQFSYGLSDRPCVPTACAGPLPPRDNLHVLAFRWTSYAFTAWVDGVKLPACVLRPHVNRGPNSHAAFFVEAVLASASSNNPGVLPLPVETYPPDVLGGAAGNEENLDESLFTDELTGKDSDGSDDGSCELSQSVDCPDIDGPVTIGDTLLCLLQQEVFCALNSSRPAVSRHICKLCPARSFPRADRLQHHLRAYHVEKRQYCCSGTKQLRIIQALFDNDQVSNRACKPGYLQRSARLLRTCAPGLDPQENSVDKHIRLVLTEKGPVFKHRACLQPVRRVKNLYYSHGFADLLFQELLLNQAKMKTATCLQARKVTK